MPKRTIRSAIAPPPLELWVRGLDGQADRALDLDARAAKLARSLVVALVGEQGRLGLSVQKMADRLGVEESKYRKDRQRVAEDPGWAPDMHVTTLANIVNEASWPLRIRETAVILARRKSYAARHGIAAATNDLAIVGAVFGAFANGLFSAPELPEWVKEIDGRTFDSWRTELKSPSSEPARKESLSSRAHTETAAKAAPCARVVRERIEERKFSAWAERVRIAQ